MLNIFIAISAKWTKFILLYFFLKFTLISNILVRTLNITTLYNVCAVPWGVFSTVGGYHDKCRDILSTVGVVSTMGDIMSTVGGIS